MRAAIYRVFLDNIEIPDAMVDGLVLDGDGVLDSASTEEIRAWMDAEGQWPNITESEEVNEELEICIIL